MSDPSPNKEYFTKHLFGAGVECPTKLYYYSEGYSQNKESIPFIRHAVFNKRLLKALARSIYPEGSFIEADTIPTAAGQTHKKMQQGNTVMFNAIFEHQQMMARLPIVAKEGRELTIFHVQTKAFDSRRHRLTDNKGEIYDKWRKYLLDFAYQLYIVRQNWPDHNIRALLVLPEKTGYSHTDNLPFLLKAKEDKQSAPVSSSNQELLVKLDVSDLVTMIWEDNAFAEMHLPRPTFEDSLHYLRDLYCDGRREEPEIGLKCKNCEFRIEEKQIEQGIESGFNECWKTELEVENPSARHVFNLIGPGVNQWIDEGVFDQREVPLDKTFDPDAIARGEGRISHKMRQSLQIHKARGKDIPEEIIRPELYRELERWQYPLHFIDFEAGNYAIPTRENRTPYDLLIFQFSCHTLHKDGHWNHHQWVDDLRSGYPNYELVRQLMVIPGIEEGTIVQYSNFERNALKTIRRELMEEYDQVPDAGNLIKWIEVLIERKDSTSSKPPYVADLSRQVKNFYYNCEMENSLSIKDVLRSVMSHSDYLKAAYSVPYSSRNFEDIIWWQPDGEGGARNPYTILMETGDSPIRRGTEAMVIYGKLITRDIGPEELQAYQKALLKYCELDTLAMMMIYQHWKQELPGEH